MATQLDEAAIDQVIRRNLGKFRKKGVYTVRPGYKFTGGWITDKPAIVATVDKKLDGLPPSQMLPAEVDDVPVDVREATGLQRLRAKSPLDHALVVTHGRREFVEPQWKFERNAQTGRLLSQAAAPAHPALARKNGKQQIKYTAPPNVPLKAVTGKMTVTPLVSPDTGWPGLSAFLKGTQSTLTIGMYDFTSAHILNTFKTVLQPSGRKLELVLDHPPRNPSANQTDDQTKSALEQLMGQRCQIKWALTNSDPVVDAYIFPTAYHIKVIVRDSKAFWLSSGNLNNSNEPDIAANDPSAGSLAKSDRDWSVVVENEILARIFEDYLKNDLAVAAARQGKPQGDPQIHQALRVAMQKHEAESAKSTLHQEPAAATAVAAAHHAVGKTFSPPQPPFDNVDVTIDPVLTPDPGDYSGKILALLQSAKKSIVMQTQYIHPSDKPADKAFTDLINMLRDKHRQGLTVRLITSQYENTPQWIEKLHGFDLDRVLRIQNRVHNKGIVVDSSVVALGSQNWSADGTLYNRDATVIIHHPGIAQYFEQVFTDDWNNRATVKIVDASHQASSGPNKPPKKKPKKGRKAPKRKAKATRKKAPAKRKRRG